jgi:hypothetical protein
MLVYVEIDLLADAVEDVTVALFQRGAGILIILALSLRIVFSY